MSALSNLKIAHRVMLLAIVALVGIIAISGIFLKQRTVEAEFRAEADQLTARQSDIAEMMGDLRDTLVAEQDFLLGRKLTAVDEFNTARGKAESIVSTLQSLTSVDRAGDLAALASGIQTYATAFAQLVRENEQLGLDQSKGLEGAMREAVHSIEKQLEQVTDAEVRASMLMMRRHEKDFILRRSPEYVDKHAAEATHFAELMKAAFKPGAQRMRVSQALDVYANAFRLYAQGTREETSARTAVTTAYADILPIVIRALDAYTADRTRSLAEIDRVATRNVTLVASLIGLVVLVILASVWLIGRSISRPVLTLAAAMRSLASGDTTCDVPGLDRRDEVGEMAAALQVFRQAAIERVKLEEDAASARAQAELDRMNFQRDADERARASLNQATGKLAQGLRSLAAGDLSFELVEPFAPDFEPLRHDLNATLTQLREVMSEIANSSQSIGSGSSELSTGAGDLAQRTERQAASLEETAAALDQITANVATSSQRAQEARAIASDANKSASRSAVLVDDAVRAMERIEQSSVRISNIIGVIDQIAFQTNLLALNAGVEAARAGEAGRGFAVVAHEVRELAQRSASAAKDIKALIEASSSEVEEGAGMVRSTGAALKEIGQQVSLMSDHMEAIALASREQSVGLAEVNTAVNHMDQSTQQNAAMVEQSNAATDVLAQEATRLRQLVSVFRLSRGRDEYRTAA